MRGKRGPALGTRRWQTFKVWMEEHADRATHSGVQGVGADPGSSSADPGPVSNPLGEPA